jgi:hypothetical protein
VSADHPDPAESCWSESASTGTAERAPPEATVVDVRCPFAGIGCPPPGLLVVVVVVVVGVGALLGGTVVTAGGVPGVDGPGAATSGVTAKKVSAWIVPDDDPLRCSVAWTDREPDPIPPAMVTDAWNVPAEDTAMPCATGTPFTSMDTGEQPEAQKPAPATMTDVPGGPVEGLNVMLGPAAATGGAPASRPTANITATPVDTRIFTAIGRSAPTVGSNEALGRYGELYE